MRPPAGLPPGRHDAALPPLRHSRAIGDALSQLRLAADPARKYEVALSDASQLAYGLDTNRGEYEFTAVLPLKMSVDDPKFLKSGFTGRISFAAGKQTMAYVLFKDFIQYITVRFF